MTSNEHAERGEHGECGEYRVARVHDRDVPWDPSQLRQIQEHPCFSANACHAFGRMHLAVAPTCNIQCNYCIREFDCVNESRPGVTSEVLSPEDAVKRVREVITDFPYIKVIGIAGPGEPLANEETFETLQLLQEDFPHLIKCLSTNGLLLPEKVDLLNELGVSNITVTLSAVDPDIGKKIYSFINYHGKKYTGREAAEIILENQLKGLERSVELGMITKVNTVLIPTINDQHIIDVAKKIKGLGVYLQNIMPLIPQYKFADITPPTMAEKRAMQDECSKVTKQMRHCRQCRADAIGLLGEDIQEKYYPASEER
ncbi:MAG: nitrogenase cofactor biosynthesis protein NifB [Methanosarcinales archaeon]|nr:nitrogenase cofactor biosynthesis protein NifB [Methanosarcinales archaeon]MCK4651716.1 nitrogenase cofactor biosynthesis protein NifB [Methanosarcinales archaeon]